MKYQLLIWLLVVCGNFHIRAQQPTYVMNGKTYYVYPYQYEMEISMRNFRMGVKKEEIIHRDSLNRNIVSTEVKDVKHYVKMKRGREFRQYKKPFLEFRRNNPGMLINFDVTLEQDLTPTLEPLPDGEYVQFYRDIPYVDEDNVLRYHNDLVAAVFSLKNNRLNGYACWFNTMGDTLKAGRFSDGLKEGPWVWKRYEINTYGAKKKEINEKNLLNGKFKDTTYSLVNYKEGLLHGSCTRGYNDLINETGFYKEGQPSGEWFEYGYKIKREGYKTIYTDERIVLYHYFLPEKKIPAKSIIVRNQIIDMNRVNRMEDNVYLNRFDAFSGFYKLHEEKEEEGLELPEEKMHSYPGEDYDDNVIYGDYGPTTLGNMDFSYGNALRNYEINGKNYSRNDLIDSVGYEFQYDKLFEEYHPNGQLKMRVEIKNGKLVKEDTIFWDNGTPVNVINFLPETKEYEEKVFDYDGKLLYHLLYDSVGNFSRDMKPKLEADKHLIRGKVYTANLLDEFFEAQNSDTLNHTLLNKTDIFESLWRFDSTTAVLQTFDPATRTVESKSYALNKDLIYHLTGQFGEDYENVMATEDYRILDLNAQTVMNGSYVKPMIRYSWDLTSDTVPNSRVKYWMRSFDLSSDYTLFQNNTPFTGKFSLTTHQPKFHLKTSENAIHMDYANGRKHEKSVEKTYRVYRKKQKEKSLAQFMTASSIYNDEVSQTLFYNLVPFAGYIVEIVDDNYFYDQEEDYSEYGMYREGKSRKLSEKKAPAFDKTVEGQFLNGKPEGLWITRDQYGNITAEVPFVNGEIDGQVRYYRTAEPEKKLKNQDDEYDYDSPAERLLKDSLPEKPTHYLAKVCHYKSGVLNGPFYEINWLNDTLTKWNYIDGSLSGPSIERNKIAYTVANYEFGDVDGISRTYLTLPGKDTTILFDLNFQNGLLQGESKSYHLNGKMAKHGFFLSGEPIDDFEAFDTLGFRYQYVKFQYNQPIEEKIWEENQLSVRYEFDWRDSIEFNTRDIAGSTSLDRLLYQLGLDGDQYRQPYMGRPSLVDKTGIDYTMTKYYPNDTIARHGMISSGKKTGCWEFYSYDGQKLYEVEYYDTILQINDSVRFKSKGILTLLDAKEQAICRSWIVEKVEKYDCSHTDHHEIRMLYTFWERDASEHRINGYVKNYYDNGVLMNEGNVKNGLATGIWKFYDPYGNLNMVGEYVLGKRNGRWLSGDLSQVKYMGDICLNPNLPNLEEIMSYQEKLLDISVIYYQMTKVKKREYYGVNMNAEGPPEGYEGEEMYYDGEMYYDEEIRSDIELR
jgi:antitoxin component YwqK of YwqJK toxin-antitoxin module